MEFLPEFNLAWFICAGALFIGCTIQASVGFGMALIAAPIIVMIKPEWIPYIMAIMAMVVSISTAWVQRKDIEWRKMASPLITRVPGTIVGTWLLSIMSVAFLQIAIAVMVLLTVFSSLWLKPFKTTSTSLGIAGFISGITGTTTSIGGPPMALVMQHSEGATTRANLSIFFFYSCIISIIGYEIAGLMTTTTWIVGLSLTPMALLGFWTGKQLQQFVDNRFRPILLIICSLSAIVALLNALLDLL